jgi:hypothetical protein
MQMVQKDAFVLSDVFSDNIVPAMENFEEDTWRCVIAKAIAIIQSSRIFSSNFVLK